LETHIIHPCGSFYPSSARFFRSLKHEELNYENFRTKEAAIISIIDV
jgi:hypothetical protein